MVREPRKVTVSMGEPGAPPSALEVQAFELVVTAGEDLGASYRGGARSVLIGSHASADLRLGDPYVSRSHARVDVVDDQGFVLRDLGSTNGTRIHGTRIREVLLDDGAVIELGSTQIRFSLLPQRFRIELARDDAFEGLVGRSVAMRELFAILARVAPSDATTLIEGETGTGKELVARAIHARSRRATGPFIVFDCGAAPAGLIEAALFGHERGAYTGAVDAQAGVFERADGGTVFLDELGELAPELQPKLLRVLEHGEVRRVGATETIRVDVRVVAATHRDLERMVAEARFREDLYYRLAVIRLRVPPLRERHGDLPLLAAHFARQLERVGILSPAALAAIVADLEARDLPGNVRELRNLVERAIVLADPAAEIDRSIGRSLRREVSLREARLEREREYLVELVAATGGDLDAAARAADLPRRSLERLLRRHKLRPATAPP
jgi:transcriptional regulator with GAF, ATPase, and Fis domain